MLRGVDELDFAVVRDTIGISDAALSKHLKVLAAAGLLETVKVASEARADSRRITWLRLTAAGREAFDDHVRALRSIAAGSDAWVAGNSDRSGRQ
ncbi:hypothetical protein GCM10011313_29550 [Mycetocola zhadangensis]|nr:hypothetical protein GCM10011313_29550 [Mycetocola zhadangensis]